MIPVRTGPLSRGARLLSGAFAVCLALYAAAPSSASAQEVVHPHELLGENLEGIYGVPNFLFHVGAAASLPPLAVSGADRAIQDWFQAEDPFGQWFPRFMLDAGFYSTIIVAGGLYAGGLVFSDEELATAGAAAIQAQAVQAVVVMLLKFLTDRAAPYRGGVVQDQPRRQPERGRGAIRRSQSATDFRGNPSQWEGGIMWPSGHTSSHVALVASLTGFYPDELWIPLIGYPLSAVMAIAMVDGDFHWFSDIVAGALIGHIIGWVIGRNFRREFDRRAAEGVPAPLRDPRDSSPPPTLQIAIPWP